MKASAGAKGKPQQPSLFSFFTKSSTTTQPITTQVATPSSPLSRFPPVASDKSVVAAKSASPAAKSAQQSTAKPAKKDASNDEGLSDSDGSFELGRKRKASPKDLAEKVTPKSAKKRKQLTTTTAADSDEEWDGDDSDSDDSDHDGNNDDDDTMDVDSDHSEPEIKKKKAAKKKPTAGSSAAKKAPAAVSSASKTPQQSVKINTAASSTSSFKFSWVTPDSSFTKAGQASSPRPVVNPLPEGVIDAGRHEHDTLDFLTPANLRDANNRRPSDPDYNPRTLKVPERFLHDQSPAMKQWWQFKAQHYDTVLFFKVGKFYELYHMDADIGYSELDLIYMKGQRAHSGFPEVSYGKYASILVNNGHRVARVEQTETPEMLKARNDSSSKGKKEKVVQRELCAVMSKGTRTFCYLDDLSILGDTDNDSGSGKQSAGASRLLCLLELPHADDEGGSQYGLACIDPVLGTVLLAQFDDDNQRTRLRTFLARSPPTEVLLQHEGYSPQTMSVIKLLSINNVASTAVDLLRGTEEVPINGEETIAMLHKGGYFLNDIGHEDIPAVLAGVFTAYHSSNNREGELVLRALGAAVKALQRALIDFEVLSLGRVYGYVPPDINTAVLAAVDEETVREEGAMDVEERDHHHHPSSKLMEALRTQASSSTSNDDNKMDMNDDNDHTAAAEGKEEARYMVLDEVALTNLEILLNNHDHTEAGSLWSFLNKCRTIGGRRLLRSWLCQPLFRAQDITYRRDAIEELLSSSLSSIADKARGILKSVPDLERLLSRVHSNGLKRSKDNHPDSRAVFFDAPTHTQRKIRDLADVLKGFESVANALSLFQSITLSSKLLTKVLRTTTNLNKLKETLSLFRTIFDEQQAKKDGYIKPRAQVNPAYDTAIAKVNAIEAELNDHLHEQRRATGISQIAFYGSGKDRFQLEVPISSVSKVPAHWSSKSQKKTHRRYWTPFIENKLALLIKAEEEVTVAREDTLRALFERFDSHRGLWSRAAACCSQLDALLSLSVISSYPGYTWPELVDEAAGVLHIEGGRHPMLEHLLADNHGNQMMPRQFIPNDLKLGGWREASVVGSAGAVAMPPPLLFTQSSDHNGSDSSSVNKEYLPRTLILTGPNMGGKSTLLRTSCLIVVMAQLGCKIPATSCILSPVDRIFTRLGAADKILAGQSTFFVELAETALILRHATTRSLCILDELGRGTATFDGTAIAHAVLEHLVSKTRCLSLFATHYHLLVEGWAIDPRVILGHMDCLTSLETEQVTFLYKLCDGCSPRSYGINVARLAGMPEAVLALAKTQSDLFLASNGDITATSAAGDRSEGVVQVGQQQQVGMILERLVSIAKTADSSLSLQELVFVAVELWRRAEATLTRLL